MKAFIRTAFAVAGLLASTLTYGATASINLEALSQGSINAGTTVDLNSFTTLTTDGSIDIGTPLFGGTNNVILGFGGGDAIFAFDTSAVSVTSITLTGASNNVPVYITTFDLDGFGQDFFATDNSWSSPSTITNSNPISGFRVELLESEISGISITYDAVSAVPVPAAVWLFGSGLIGLAGIARRKQS